MDGSREYTENNIFDGKRDVVSMFVFDLLYVLAALHFHSCTFGVTCWEIFTCGRVPYHRISAMDLLFTLKNGERPEKLYNGAWSDEMYVHYYYEILYSQSSVTLQICCHKYFLE